MADLMNESGQIVDKELNELSLKIMAEVNRLFTAKTEWTLQHKIVAAFHLQGYINSEVMRCIMEKVMAQQGAAATTGGLRLQPPAKEG